MGVPALLGLLALVAVEGPFLKGQLHLHSSRSGDSATAPRDVAKWYESRGYDFIVFTDHEHVTVERSTPAMLVLPGVELTQNSERCHPEPPPGMQCLLHVNALFVTPPAGGTGAVPWGPRLPPNRLALYRRALRAARALGGVAQLNHPNFHYAADAALITRLAADGLLLLEIANEAWDSNNQPRDPGRPSTEALWDAVLSTGANVYGTATDDAHHYHDAMAARQRGEDVFPGDRGFVMVRAKKDAGAIRAAVERGDFYSSTGVFLARVDRTATTFDLEVAARSAGPHQFQFIGRDGKTLARAQGRTASFPLAKASGGYVRAVISDAEGRRAWTQPSGCPEIEVVGVGSPHGEAWPTSRRMLPRGRVAASFPRTLRSLRADGFRGVGISLAVAVVLLAAWTGWFTLGSVRIFERSEVARVEVAGAPQAIQTPVSGTVLTADLTLGRLVTAGEVLVELDSRPEALALEEATRVRDTAGAQVEYLRAELAAAGAATRDDQMAARAALAEAQAKKREAEARVALAEEEASGLTKLRESGHVGDIERLRATTEAQTRQASAQASQLSAARLDWAQRTSTSDRLAAIARLRREVVRVEGEKKVASASIEKLAHEIERRKLRSPVAGRIGEVMVLRQGSVVHEGDRLATVVPSGELRVVAEFPQATVGRLRRGQPARVRLTSFNWAEFGDLTASVISVATEPHEGRVRTELRLLGQPPRGIPLQHGLEGVVDVEVERTSPATLVLRAAGRYLGDPPPAQAAEPAAPVIGRRP